ncbi:MAG: PadR family transcriptional regulator [Clostridiales bacterium]|nr:PadR family transcriptional regulator [Clostridiales bacterium]
MSLEYAILGFLRERPMTGYELKTACFDVSASHFWTADQSQIYRTLDRLEDRAQVSVKRQRQRSRPDRLIYSITASGARDLDTWITRAEPPPPVRDPFLVRLRFAEHLTEADLLGVLHARRETLQQRLETLRKRASASTVHGPHEPVGHASVLSRLSLDAAMARLRAEIDWIDDSVEMLATTFEQERVLEPGAQGRLFAPKTSTPEGGAR